MGMITLQLKWDKNQQRFLSWNIFLKILQVNKDGE